MFSYSELIKKSYYICRNNLILWPFGLFVVGGFSLNFLHFLNFPVSQAAEMGRAMSVASIVVYFQIHPAVLAMLSFSVLTISIGGLVLTNWCRIMLVKLTNSLLEHKDLKFQHNFKLSVKTIWRVVKISLLTSLLMLLVASALLGPPLWTGFDPTVGNLLLLVGACIFVPLAFTISCINIFTTYYVVLYDFDFKQALNLGTDFFAANWIKILGLSFILAVIFLAGSSLGGAVIYSSRVLVKLVLAFSQYFSFFWLSATIWIIRCIAAVFLWLTLAVVNVFFNTALLLLFLKLQTTTKVPDLEKTISVAPVTT